MNKPEISYRLRRHRVLNDMTQEDLAAFLGTNVYQIVRWELCKNKPQKKWIDRMKERGVL